MDYKIDETARGVWKRYMYQNGKSYHEYTSYASVGTLPMVHYTYGICPETGRRKIAKGVIAIGRIAVGGIAIGQASAGVIGIGQASFGLIFALAQAAIGLTAIGQLALSIYFAIGQFALGYTAIGQFAFGHYAMGQMAFGNYVWHMKEAMPEAVEYFKGLVGL